MDKITNWYSKLDKKNQDIPTVDKDFNKHFILPNSRIALIGGSGVGKTNILMEFLHLFFHQNNQTKLSYPMVKALMKSQSFKKLICEGKIVPQNHLLDLYPFISHMRERYVLQKAIECIDHVEKSKQ